MRSSMAYFAGAGTVVAAIAAGLGGGFVISSIVSPNQPKQGGTEMTRLERRISPEPIPANGELEPVPYLAASQISAAVAETPAPQPQPKPSPQQAAPAQTAAQAPESAQPASPPAAQSAAATEPAAARKRPAGEESFAKTRDADVGRDARRAKEKRKYDRRQPWGEKQLWTERRKWRPREDDDLRDVREVERRETFAAEPARIEMPRIRLFGLE